MSTYIREQSLVTIVAEQKRGICPSFCICKSS
nr:MAG TPA: hypothetical protein [Caudoviricetes sp.]